VGTVANLADISVEIFGGLNTSMPPADLPPGSSPLNQDVEFPEGAVRTRPGKAPFFSLDGASITGLKTYQTPNYINRLIALLEETTNGALYKESSPGVMSLISTDLLPNSIYQSVTLFGREYMAFFLGNTGNDIPRQFDDTNFDRVSQNGVGAAPTVNPFLPAPATIASSGSSFTIAAAPTGTVRGGSVIVHGVPHYLYVTVTTTAPHGLSVGQAIIVAGVTDPNFDGSFTVMSVPSATTFTYQQTSLPAWGSTSGGGTVATYAIIRSNNVVTVTTTAAHHFQVGWTVQIAGLPVEALTYTSLTFTSAAGVVTVTLNGGSTAGLIPGTEITVSGVADPTFNGTFPIQQILNSTQFTYAAVTISSNPAAYTAAGNVATAVPNSGGAGGYIFGDILALTGGNGQGAVQVTSVDGSGNPLSYNIINTGGGYTAGSVNTTGGTGSGATVTITTGSLVVAAITTTFNGLFTITSVPSPTTFTYAQAGPNLMLNPMGATATIVGNISGGLHGISVSFITRQGYITKPAPPAYFSAPGFELATISNIPTGPSNVVGRLLMFTPFIPTPATTGSFYSIALTMQINDNTTTTAIVDFTDAALIASLNCNYLFNLQELGEVAFMGGYNSRTVGLGERYKLPNLVNLEFDGGWKLAGGLGGSDIPLGWTNDPTYGSGGSRDTVNSDWMDGYRITGDGATAILGMITQSAYQDYLGVNILNINTSYSIRVRLVQTGMIAGAFTAEIYSPSAGSLGTFSVAAALIPTTYNLEFSGPIMAAQTVIPADAVLRIYSSSTVNAGGYFTVDNIELFPTLLPINSDNARLSYAFNPESYDSVTSNISVRPGDGQVLRAGFPLRTSYYLAKDHYLGYVVDDGVNEPSGWKFNEVSSTIGICGPNAVAVTEEWAVFAERSGVYILMGGDPIKVNQEIMEDGANLGRVCWASINWLYGYTIWVRVDQLKKRIYIGAPVNAATSPNVIFVMDYRFSGTPELIAAGPGVVYSQFTGGLISHGAARKWTLWNVAAPAACLSERPDGTAQLFTGGTMDGNVYNYPPTNLTDNGAPIISFWQGYGMPAHREEQDAQTKAGPLRSHNKLCTYLSGRAVGNGALVGAAPIVSMTQTVPGIVQVVFTGPHGLNLYDWVIVTGAADPSYNGYWQVVSTPNANTFTYLATTSLPATTGATVTGTLNITAIAPDRSVRVRGVSLLASTINAASFERPMNLAGTRIYFQIGTSVPGGWFQLEKLISTMEPHPTIPVRGSGI
jgi:hypothetical protein